METSTKRRLTDYAACGGCASKLAAGDLHHVLGGLPPPIDPRVLVDYRTADDAGCLRDRRHERARADGRFLHADCRRPLRLRPDRRRQRRVATSTPWAARPLTALAVAAFPAKDFDPADIAAVFRGGLDKLREAGVALLGGHTVQDAEIKFGYAVTGLVRSRAHAVERRRPAGRRAAADQAARHWRRSRPP